MQNMTLKHIAESIRGQLILPREQKNGANSDIEQREIQGVVVDHRRLEAGYLFVPMKGAHVDGHVFIPDAFARGAMAVLSEQELTNPAGPYILVADTAAALKDLAAFYRSGLDTYIIGIVGSVGKTSTKEMTAAVLGQHFSVLKTQGNFNNEIGLPLTICRIQKEHQVAVVEMGISDFNEMDRLGKIARPNMVIMTNIGLCHLEKLKDRDGILQAKTEVIPHMPKDGILILNGDDDKLCHADAQGREVHFYGLRQQEFSAKEIKGGLTEVEVMLHTPAWEQKLHIPMPGQHNVYNALAAAAAGTCLGMSREEIVAGIETIQAVDGRNHFIERDGVTVIDDCYNANPVSMEASLEVLSHSVGRRIAVLGDMGELGADERSLHYRVGEAVARYHIDLLYTAGTLAKEIGRGARESGAGVCVFSFENKEEMIQALKQEQKKGDTILVKASHFMNFQEVVKKILN